MGYDSGMEKRTKREIRRLVLGVKDPRRGFGTAQGIVRKIVGVLVLADFVGWILILLLSAPLAIPFGYLGGLVAGWKGQAAGAIAGMVVFIAWVFRATWIQAKVELAGKECDYELCLWCHHSITGLSNRGICPECGKGFDRAVSQALLKQIFQPASYTAASKVVNTRSAQLWARALRERDRSRDE